MSGWRSAPGRTPAKYESPSPEDGAQVIFTTGSTGSPKPALLSHRGITCQNLCLGTAFEFGPGKRVLCNLPASHVGGQAEILITSLFTGATAVTLEIFDPVKSLDAIEQHGVTLIGQIPAMFNLEWRTADYAKRNLSSLESAVYGGQAVPRPFLERMLTMAPRIATGLGMTEASGFCTYTRLTPDPGEIEGNVGWAMPAYRMTVREAMDGGGIAGAEVKSGEVGHICFAGPQNFLGYVNDEQSTAGAPVEGRLALHRRSGGAWTSAGCTSPGAQNGSSSPLATRSSPATWRTTSRRSPTESAISEWWVTSTASGARASSHS